MSKGKAAWSFSVLEMFKQCPHKYYRLKVAKDVRIKPSHAMTYGRDVHKAAEEYIKRGEPLDPQFDFMAPALERLRARPGKKYCELKMGLTEDLEPCGFFDRDVWLRVVADLIIKRHKVSTAQVIDYKTSKTSEYADTSQLELIALGVFRHFPEIERVKAGLLFVVCNDLVTREYSREHEKTYWRKWNRDVAKLQAAHDNGVWNKVQNFTCYGCPVTDCEFWKPARRSK